jgi:hypothetical protein
MVQSWSMNRYQPLRNTAFGSHPRRVFSCSYELTGFFHGGNAGSNPAGDAIFSMTYKFLDLLHRSLALHPE